MAASPRLYCPVALSEGMQLNLSAAASRHVQVLRMQPGQNVVLFGHGAGQWLATITSIGRSQVTVTVENHELIERETPLSVHLALGLVANDRMDSVLEKATELGAASFTLLETERCVVKLSGERAQKRLQHWQAVVASACEQCGRNTVAPVGPVVTLNQYLLQAATGNHRRRVRFLLSLSEQAKPLHEATKISGLGGIDTCELVCGPEGGWTTGEEALLTQAGWIPVSLGPRTLRADTAPLAALAALTLNA
jgi:16S rRNA (uracil1498-N3)-methyltransferase